jgi:hypothetical protein
MADGLGVDRDLDPRRTIITPVLRKTNTGKEPAP